jgi:hypothetical protein
MATAFHIADSGNPAAIASGLALGPETLLPDAFGNIRSETDSEQLFRYYLSQDLDLDRDEHSVMARELVGEICGDVVGNRPWRAIDRPLWDQHTFRLAVAGRFLLVK